MVEYSGTAKFGYYTQNSSTIRAYEQLAKYCSTMKTLFFWVNDK